MPIHVCMYGGYINLGGDANTNPCSKKLAPIINTQ